MVGTVGKIDWEEYDEQTRWEIMEEAWARKSINILK